MSCVHCMDCCCEFLWYCCSDLAKCCSPMAIIRTPCGANNVMGYQICLTLWTCDHNKWTVCSSLWASSVEFDFSPVCVLKCLLKCLKCLLTPSRVRGLFPGREPFWAGYGNKAWDILAYKVDILGYFGNILDILGYIGLQGGTPNNVPLCIMFWLLQAIGINPDRIFNVLSDSKVSQDPSINSVKGRRQIQPQRHQQSENIKCYGAGDLKMRGWVGTMDHNWW